MILRSVSFNWIKHLVAASVAVIVFGPIGFWAMDRTPPIIPTQGVITPGQAYPGQEVQVDWTVQVHGYCRGMVHREIIDAQRSVHILERLPTVIRDDEFHVSRRFIIPSKVALGPAKYRVVTEYYCNPLQRWLRWPVAVRSPDAHVIVVPQP